MLEVSTADGTRFGRAADGTYSAYGYRYVLPQRFTYQPAGSKNLRFSFVSLDRSTTPDSVLVGEYDVDGEGTRLVRWNIDHTDRELVATGAKATASWAYQVDIRSMQGVNSVRGKYFISRSNGKGSRGDLITWKPGQDATIHTGALPSGPEDLAYRRSTDEMWTVSEYPGDRHVFSVTAGKF